MGEDSEVVDVSVREVEGPDGRETKVVTTTKRTITTRTVQGEAESGHEEVEVESKTTATATATTTVTETKSSPLAYLAAYEEWVKDHTSLARNIETLMYIAPQLVPVRLLAMPKQVEGQLELT